MESIPKLGSTPLPTTRDEEQTRLDLPVIKSAPIGLQAGTSRTPLADLVTRLADDEPETADARVSTYANVSAVLATADVQAHSTVAVGRGTRLRTAIAAPLKTLGLLPADKVDPTVEKADLLRELSDVLGKRKVDLATFKVAFRVRGDAFAERLFKALDTDGNGFISDEQLITTLLALRRGTIEDRIAFVFSIINSNGSGMLSFDQLVELLQASCSEGKLIVSNSTINKLAKAFFHKAGKQVQDTLTLEDFTNVLRDQPELLRNLRLAGIDLSAKLEEEADLKRAVSPLHWYERWLASALLWLQIENVQLAFWLLLLSLAEVAAFAVGFVRNDQGIYKQQLGWSYPIAKGAAESIKVVMILLFFTVARNLLTQLRQLPLAVVLPLDDNISVHKVLAFQLFFWSWLHTLSHFVNGARQKTQSEAAWYRDETQVTGVMLISILVVGYLFASPWPRMSRWVQKSAVGKVLNNFNAFHVTHMFMAVSLVVLLIIHPYPGPAIHPEEHRSTTWAYLVAGVAVYIVERMFRWLKQALWSSEVMDVQLHAGNVIELKLSRPRWGREGLRAFRYMPGQYSYIMVPRISRWEWHPFSLTSAPSDDFISFHIRAVGDWTRSLYKLCQVQLENDYKERAKHDPFREAAGISEEPLQPKGVIPSNMAFKVNVDGPFGAPAQGYEEFTILLLVGAGIGVTPFASILRQLVDDYNSSKCTTCNTPNKRLFAPRKVYFYWTIREQQAPLYFQKTLEAIQMAECSEFLSINIHLTTVKPDNDLRVTIARVAAKLQHDEDGYDAFTGTHTPVPCSFGRPNWDAVFSKIAKTHPGARVGVFACGPMQFTSPLKGHCIIQNKRQDGAAVKNGPRKSTRFIFHKEIF